jgi:hypothetical protein
MFIVLYEIYVLCRAVGFSSLQYWQVSSKSNLIPRWMYEDGRAAFSGNYQVETKQRIVDGQEIHP